MDDLVAFLRRCLDDDERAIERMRSTPMHGVDSGAEEDYLMFANRAPAEVKAKRRILDAGAPRCAREETGEYLRFGSWTSCSDDCTGNAWWEILKLLAQPYAGHDGWREEWRADPDS